MSAEKVSAYLRMFTLQLEWSKLQRFYFDIFLNSFELFHGLRGILCCSMFLASIYVRGHLGPSPVMVTIAERSLTLQQLLEAGRTFVLGAELVTTRGSVYQPQAQKIARLGKF